jgi:hypothetical protein
MRDLLAFDARDFVAANAPEPKHRNLAYRRATDARAVAATPRRPRRSGAAASETTTMIVVLVAWALIAGYLFAHVAEGAAMAGTESHIASVHAPHAAARA